MKKSMKIPTILGVLILSLGLLAGVYLINSRQIFKLGAEADSAPQNVRVSNITDTSVTVSWTTDIETNGFVKWGEAINKLNKISSEEDGDKNFIHSLELSEIAPGSEIFFVIGSNKTTHDNNGVAWQTRTNNNASTMPQALTATGTILQTDEKTPANALVYLSINGVILSNITSFEGSFVIPVSNYISSLSDTTLIEITVHAGPIGISQAVLYPKTLKAIPTMSLGKTYDFRTVENVSPTSLPESTVSVPVEAEPESRFDAETSGSVETTSVTLESVDQGETITTTDPEFFGKGPAGITIEVTLQSELQTGTVSVNSDGSWNWNPPNNLEPGEHSVTLKWTDVTGVLRTLTRTFVVSASEGPAFEASTSGTLATPTPSTKPQATITPQPVPETGDLTATLGLFIMGLGILLSSVYVWNKAYAEI